MGRERQAITAIFFPPGSRNSRLLRRGGDALPSGENYLSATRTGGGNPTHERKLLTRLGEDHPCTLGNAQWRVNRNSEAFEG